MLLSSISHEGSVELNNCKRAAHAAGRRPRMKMAAFRLTKREAPSDGGRVAPGGCRSGLSEPSRQPPEGFAFLPPFRKGDVQERRHEYESQSTITVIAWIPHSHCRCSVFRALFRTSGKREESGAHGPLRL